MRPKGHIRDDQPPIRLTPHARLIGDVQVPSTAMLPGRVDDQQGQSCTGSYSMLVESWCGARGIPCAPVSRFFGYKLGRQLSDPGAPLRDLGANPASVVGGMRIIGVTPESACPSGDLSTINDPLPFFQLEIGCTFQVRDISVIEEDGAARCAAIRRAIATGFPVGIALDVDQAFEDWSSDRVYDGASGVSLGGHAIRAIGYRPGAIRLLNSWDESWADAGGIWVSDKAIGSSQFYDAYILNFAPSVKS